MHVAVTYRPRLGVRLTAEYEGEEYDVLLRYVAEQGEALKNKKESGDDDEESEDEGKGKYKRIWYMPWKKVKQDQKAAKVRLDFSWLRLDYGQRAGPA